MNYLFPLQKIQCKKHLFNDDSHIRLIEPLVALQCLKQSPIRLVLKYHVYEVVILEEVKEADDAHALLQ